MPKDPVKQESPDGCCSESVKNNPQKPLKLLLVDDQKIILEIVKKSIATHLQNVAVDITLDSHEAVNLIKNNDDYDFILTDIEMPIMSGINMVKEIRKFNQNIPIVAYTSLINVKEQLISSGINDYHCKHGSLELVIRSICKWNLIKYVPFIEKNLNANYQPRILLADDNPLTQLWIKQGLERNDFEVETVRDGQELIDEYIDKLPGKKSYDMIIANVHMPLVTGIQATESIMHYNKENNVKDHIPIIAYTNDKEREKIHTILNAKMTDYFVKGDKIDYLINLVNFWIYHRA